MKFADDKYLTEIGIRLKRHMMKRILGNMKAFEVYAILAAVIITFILTDLAHQ